MLYREFTLENTAKLNSSLYERFLALSSADRMRQSHHFAGRFENIYFDRADIPEIEPLVSAVARQAGALLGLPPAQLKAGFWFNAMGPGHVTALHHHDENDELLSAVYYIRVPEHAGDLLLYDDEEQVTRVKPEEGKLVLFAPDVSHEVTENLSTETRLSVAFNVGPVESE